MLLRGVEPHLHPRTESSGVVGVDPPHLHWLVPLGRPREAWLATGRGCWRCAVVGEGLAVTEVGAHSSGPIRGPCSNGPTGRTCLHLLVAVLASPQMPCEWHTRREGPVVAVRSGRPSPMARGRAGRRNRPMVLAVRVGRSRVGQPDRRGRVLSGRDRRDVGMC